MYTTSGSDCALSASSSERFAVMTKHFLTVTPSMLRVLTTVKLKLVYFELQYSVEE